MKTATTLTRSLLIPLFAAGCYDIDDLSAVSKPDAEAAPDDSWQSAADAGSDAWATPDAQVAACTSTSDCADGDVCAPDGTCMHRCDGAGACVVASTKHEVTSLVASGSSVYVALAASYDRFFNANPDAELRTIVGDAPWSLLVARMTHSPTNLELHAEHLYWQEDQRLLRIPRDAHGAVEAVHPELSGDFVLSDERLAVRTNDGLFVGSVDGSGTATKLLDASECAMDAAFGGGCTSLALTHDALFYQREANDALYLSSIDLGTSTRSDHGGSSGSSSFAEVAGPYFYGLSASLSPRVYRRDLRDSNADGTTSDFAVYYLQEDNFFLQGYRPVQLHGDWVYVLATTPSGFSGGDDYRFVRAAAVGPVNVQDLLPKPFGPRGMFQLVGYAVGDAHLFVAVRMSKADGIYGTLIYRVPLPANQ